MRIASLALAMAALAGFSFSEDKIPSQIIGFSCYR